MASKRSYTGHHCLSAAEQAPRTGPGRCREHHRMVTIAFRLRSKLHPISKKPTYRHPLGHHCLSAAEQAPHPMFEWRPSAATQVTIAFRLRSKLHELVRDGAGNITGWSPLPFGCGASSTTNPGHSWAWSSVSPLPFGCGASSTTGLPGEIHRRLRVTIAFRLRSKLHRFPRTGNS